VRFSFGCELSCTVSETTTFIFNLQAARLARHAELREQLTFSPNAKPREYAVPDLKTRYIGVDAAPGALSVRYSAETDLLVYRADPASVSETPLKDIPLDVLPFLLPSRFVPSDRLAAFAQREFGALPQGHSRIT
jgi:hypothetical protein